MNPPRDQILAKVRAALAPLPQRAALPDWSAELAVARKLVEGRDPVELFAERTKLVNARCLFSAADLVRDLAAGGWKHGYCDPALWPLLQSHFGPEFKVQQEFDRTRVDDYAFGITRAAGAIAETGTIILDDRTTSRRLGALAPWVHVAIVTRSSIHETLADAVTRLGDDPNVIYVTGPSKTADVEGILIEGVHGPGVQYALIVD
jgi:L-lactate dehydrogenase complex protein LldG